MSSSWATPARLRRAQEHLHSCCLCEHRCGVNRRARERGPCKVGIEARVFRHRIEYSEETELVPAHLFYLSGCDLRCAFCIAGVNAFDPHRGERLTREWFHQAVAWGQQQHARTLEWVGGEPTVHIPAVLEAMSGCPDLPPVAWKSDFYFTPEAFELLDGMVDVFVADFKFGNNVCARRIARVDNYVEVVGRNLMLAAGRADLIVRHLLLPGHLDCCYRPIVAWVGEHMPGVKFSLRDGYLPHWQARRHTELAQPLPTAYARQAKELAMAAGLKLAY